MLIIVYNALSVTVYYPHEFTARSNEMNVITTAHGVQYRRQEFTDAWGRKRVCDRRLDTLPRPRSETCAVCGQPISAERSTRRFCSAACRVRAHRQRQRVASGSGGD